VAVARRARGFGASVVFFDPEVSLEEGAAQRPKVSFEELLAQSGFRDGPRARERRTKNMFDADAFAAMKEGAPFINTLRASLADEAPLLTLSNPGTLPGRGSMFSQRTAGFGTTLSLSRKTVITTPAYRRRHARGYRAPGSPGHRQLHQLMRV